MSFGAICKCLLRSLEDAKALGRHWSSNWGLSEKFRVKRLLSVRCNESPRYLRRLRAARRKRQLSGQSVEVDHLQSLASEFQFLPAAKNRRRTTCHPGDHMNFFTPHIRNWMEAMTIRTSSFLEWTISAWLRRSETAPETPSSTYDLGTDRYWNVIWNPKSDPFKWSSQSSP